MFATLVVLMFGACSSKPQQLPEPQLVPPAPPPELLIQPPTPEPSLAATLPSLPIADDPSPPLEKLQPEPSPIPPSEPPQSIPDFDPTKVSAEVKQVAFVDIRAFIENLNKIIQRQDFEAWKSFLSPAYIEYYSSQQFLVSTSANPRFKNAGIKLQSLKDYFIHVVYPSHQNDHIDDIEFIGEHMVKAFTKGTDGQLYVLYRLEKIDNAWKIGIGR